MVVVAIEQTYPPRNRLVLDELAARFLPTGIGPLVAACRLPAARKAMIALSDRRAPGVWGGVLCRKRNLYRDFVTSQPLWQFGLNPPEVAGLLAEYGWHEQQQCGAAEFTQTYMRPVGRDLRVTEVERSVYAEKP